MPQWMLEQLIYLVPYVQVLDMKWKKSSNIVECQKEHLQAPFLLPNTYRVRSPFSFVSSSGVSSKQPNGCFYQHWFQHYQLTLQNHEYTCRKISQLGAQPTIIYYNTIRKRTAAASSSKTMNQCVQNAQV